MSWFSKPAPYEPESDAPPPLRTASDEYLAGLKFVANIYEKRAEAFHSDVKERASSIAASTNFERFESDFQSIRHSVDLARSAGGIASEIRGWINDFEFRGYRPPHLPPLPPTKSESSGE